MGNEELSKLVHDLPYPIAFHLSKALLPPGERPARSRLDDLIFATQALLKTVVYPLVRQYLALEAISPDDRLRRSIDALQQPTMHRWIDTLRHCGRVFKGASVMPCWPELSCAIGELNCVRWQDCLNRQTRGRAANSFDALVGLRNHLSHGHEIPEPRARELLEQHLPILEFLLQQFPSLSKSRLVAKMASVASGPREPMQRGGIVVLHGPNPRLEPFDEQTMLGKGVNCAALMDELDQHGLAVVTSGGMVFPVYPLVVGPWQSPQLVELPPHPFFYDGHNRTQVSYLGFHEPQYHGAPEHSALLALLKRKSGRPNTADDRIDSSLAASTRSSSEDVLLRLHNVRYFPGCFQPRRVVQEEYERFLNASPEAGGPPFESTFILSGRSGSGKTSQISQWVSDLIGSDVGESVPSEDSSGDVVVFLQGSDMRQSQDEDSRLLPAIRKALGLVRSVRKPAELLKFLKAEIEESPERRVIFFLDAVNEAPLPGQVLQEVLDLGQAAARYPWCKVVMSVRENWLRTRLHEHASTASGPFFGVDVRYLHPYFHQKRSSPDCFVPMLPLSEEECRDVYVRTCQHFKDAGFRTCELAWDDLPETLRCWTPDAAPLLSSPLLMRLFILGFQGDASAIGLKRLTEGGIYAEYAKTLLGAPSVPGAAVAGNPRLRTELQRWIKHMLESATTEFDAEWVERVDRAWKKETGPAASISYSPSELLEDEGLIVRSESGYRFASAALGEFLVEWHVRDTGADRIALIERLSSRRSHELSAAITNLIGAQLKSVADAPESETARSELCQVISLLDGDSGQVVADQWVVAFIVSLEALSLSRDGVRSEYAVGIKWVIDELARHGSGASDRLLMELGSRLTLGDEPAWATYVRHARVSCLRAGNSPDPGQRLVLCRAELDLGESLVAGGRPSEAIECFKNSRDLLDAGSQSTEDGSIAQLAAYLGRQLGSALARVHRYDESLACLDAALRELAARGSRSPDLELEWARLNREKGSVLGRSASATDAMPALDAAIASYRSLTGLGSVPLELAKALVAKARALATNWQFTEAIALVDEALELLERSGSRNAPTRILRARALDVRAKALLNLGKTAQARDSSEKTVGEVRRLLDERRTEFRNDMIIVLLTRARVLLAEESHHEAMAVVDDVATRTEALFRDDPSVAHHLITAHRIRGRIFLRLDRPREAVHALQCALVAQRDHGDPVETHCLLCQAHILVGDVSAARDALERACERLDRQRPGLPENVAEAKAGWFDFLLAQIRLREGAVSEAQVLLKRAMECLRREREASGYFGLSETISRGEALAEQFRATRGSGEGR